MRIRRAEDRGFADRGWLRSFHTFSFADYRDPNHMGFRALRVINDDTVAPGRGFASHPHRDMEILSWVLDGALEHRDSMGNGSVIRPNELQRMRAGTGVVHSEQNASATAPVHFLQIWILPDTQGLTPGYAQRAFPLAERLGAPRLIASRDGRSESLSVAQDVDLYAVDVDAAHDASFALRAGRHLWLHVATGSVEVEVEGTKCALVAGDAVATSAAASLRLRGAGSALLFDLA